MLKPLLFLSLILISKTENNVSVTNFADVIQLTSVRLETGKSILTIFSKKMYYNSGFAMHGSLCNI